MENQKTYRGCDYYDRDGKYDSNWRHPQQEKKSQLSAHDWLEANKEKWPNTSTVSEIMEDYARYYYIHKKKEKCMCNSSKTNVDGKNNN